MSDQKVFTLGSLFAGIGGLELGLEMTGRFKTVWQVEQSEYCRKVLRKHWPDALQFEDVRDVGKGNLPAVDVICGGFPCQDISNAGRKAGIVAGNRSGLWHEYVRIIRDLRPQYVIVENVSALLVRGLDVVLGELAEIGYDAEWSMLSAADVGAPHLRERVFLVAYAERQRPAARTSGGFRKESLHDGNRDGERAAVGRLQLEHRASRIGESMANAAGDGRRQGEQDERRSAEGVSESRILGDRPRLGCETVADSDSGRCEQRDPDERRFPEFDSQRPAMAYPIGSGQPRQGQPLHSRNPATDREGQASNALDVGIGSQWSVEPNVGRVANGVPARTHRLTALGNAVVPQCARVIGEWLLEIDAELNERGAA